MTSGSGRRTPRPPARWLLAIGLVCASVVMPGTAHAFWSEGAVGMGEARVATLPSIDVTASSPQHSARVELEWQEPALPAGMSVSGYRVQRAVAGALTDACGSTSSSLLPPATLACTDALLDDGEYDYIVTAQVGSWTTSGQLADGVVVAADRTGPEVRLNGVGEDSAVLAHRDGTYLLIFRSTAPGGSLRVDAAVTDTGVGPASARFPLISAAGWTHAWEDVASGTGTEPTVTYRSSVISFTSGAAVPSDFVVVGVDDRGNESSVPVRFVDDTTAPTGGSVTVNGVAASAAGSSSVATGSFAIEAPTEYVEDPTATAAGIDSTTLVRESASLVGGDCGGFGGSTSVDGPFPVVQSGLADGCYRYTLTGYDRVGNTASVHTVVKVDTRAPVGGAVRANGVDATPGGSSSYDRTGAWSLTRVDYTDTGVGLDSSTLVRSTASLADGSCGDWTSAVLAGAPNESGQATGCVRYTLTGTDLAALSSEVSTTVLVDREAPTGGSVIVNGVTSSGAGTASVRTVDNVEVTAITPFMDAASGMESSVLVRTFAPMAAGACGVFDPASAVTITGEGVISGLADGCHRFTLTGLDLAGNTATVATTVRLDASAPEGGALTAGGVDGTPDGVMAYVTTSPVPVSWTKFVDPESGMTSARVQRTTAASLSDGLCGAYTGAVSNLTTTLSPVTGTSNQSLSTQCYRYVLTGTNALGVTSTLQVFVMIDTSNPTSSGSLRVNNSTSATSTNTTGTYAVETVRTFADTNSGIASNELTRTFAPVVASVCGAFDPATTVVLGSPIVVPPVITEAEMAPGCYRYTQTGTNTVGRSSAVSTTVRVDTTAPVDGALVANGIAATTDTGSTSFSGTGAWSLLRTDFIDPETTLTSTLTRAVSTSLTNGTCSRPGTARTVVGAPDESGITGGCIRYVLTGRNTLNLTAPVLVTVVMVDTTAPTGGALTVNGVTATTGGSTSTSLTGSYSVTTLTAMTDGNSGMASSTLTRTSGPTCDALDPETETVLSGPTPIAETGMSPGCYRYDWTGVNNAGLSRTLSTTVTVAP